ncbi:HTH domain-containing protein [Mycoplasmopsis californica]|uniref:HTH domain-containing protein n=1 Tax=Mycoplasmopsis californica TaxID=2113 RepID=UPI001F2145D6|nr:HTH domain-containing protein [Mycoplasmopsis californica]
MPDGLTLENIKMGMVAKRNKIIVNTLDKIDVIENYGSSVRRIFDDYADFAKRPEYYISNNGVILTLFNKNHEAQNLKLNNQKRIEKILELIKENKNITKSNLKNILGVSKSTIERDILKLREEDKLEYIGSSKNGYWKIKNK